MLGEPRRHRHHRRRPVRLIANPGGARGTTFDISTAATAVTPRPASPGTREIGSSSTATNPETRCGPKDLAIDDDVGLPRDWHDGVLRVLVDLIAHHDVHGRADTRARSWHEPPRIDNAAHRRGYHVNSEEVRTAVLVSLVGTGGKRERRTSWCQDRRESRGRGAQAAARGDADQDQPGGGFSPSDQVRDDHNRRPVCRGSEASGDPRRSCPPGPQLLMQAAPGGQSLPLVLTAYRDQVDRWDVAGDAVDGAMQAVVERVDVAAGRPPAVAMRCSVVNARSLMVPRTRRSAVLAMAANAFRRARRGETSPWHHL